MSKILIVDDNADNSEVLKLILEETESDVFAVSNSSDFFSVLESFTPDLVFLDVLLGNANGVDLCRELKLRGSTAYIKVVLMSAGTSLKNKWIEAGADAFMEKPFDISEPIRLVEKLTNSMSNLKNMRQNN